MSTFAEEREWTMGELREWCNEHVGEKVVVLGETFTVRLGAFDLLYLEPVKG